MISSSSSAFDLLPARPPTPPRDPAKAADDACAGQDDNGDIEAVRGNRKETALVLDAPTPSSSQDVDVASNPSKRVGFSPWPIYHQLSGNARPESPIARLQRHSPLTRTLPGKSILKLSSPLTPDDLERRIGYFPSESPRNFADMLQAAVQHLASASRPARLDAYTSINGALRVYGHDPDTDAMIPQMGLITQFLARDIAWKDSDGSLDTRIIPQALQLALNLLSQPKLRDAIDADFQAFVVDRSIAVMQQEDMPKQVVKMQMAMLVHQRFGPAVITTTRAERIIVALRDIELRCSGNNVVATRLVIYQRLLEQTPSVMLAKMPDWFAHIFHGMLSSIREIRIRAIDVGNQAGLVLGVQPAASKALCDMMDADAEDGQTYYSYLEDRLLKMVADKESGIYVPQIWAVVTLFFRNKRRPLDKWAKFKSWLLVIQKCLNTSDPAVRQHAYLAWNKLIFAIMPDSSTSKSFLPMLKVPIFTGLDKRGNDKHAKTYRQIALDSFYMLLHYSLRPGLTYAEYDVAWTTFVEPLLSQSVVASAKGRTTACRVLQGLFNSTTGVWNANAAFEATPLTPHDLPKLDPRWVRSRLDKLLVIIKPMVLSSFAGDAQAEPTVEPIWAELMRVLAEAGNQEVKASSDLKEAMALLVNLFREMWNSCAADVETSDHWLRQFTTLMDAMISNLGATHFTEEILSTDKNEAIEAATPSHRTSKGARVTRAPFIFLFDLFWCPTPRALVSSQAYQDSTLTILRSLLASKTDAASRIALLKDAMSLWGASGRTVTHESWGSACACTAVLQVVLQDLQSGNEHDSAKGSQALGEGLHNALQILIMGVPHIVDFAGGDGYELIAQYYNTACSVAKTAAGDAGVVIAAKEPFADGISSMELPNRVGEVSLESRLRLARIVLQDTIWPRSRQAMEQARKSLWSVGLASHKIAVFDPFDKVYSMTTRLMEQAYGSLGQTESAGSESVSQFLTSVVGFLKACPGSLLITALRKMQSGFVLWVEDRLSKTSNDGNVASVICTLWPSILMLLRSLPKKDSNVIRLLEPLLVAGFSSPHRSIVNATIEFWNDVMDSERSLEYPARLESVLRARAVDADLCLPAFPESGEGHPTAELPPFYDSQVVESHQPPPPDVEAIPSRPSPVKAPTGMSLRSKRSSTKAQPAKPSSPTTSAREATPKARLRHDDSQVEFAAIESSPPHVVEDSQLLTEHQKEVKARQQQDAHMFSDFSSPMAHSTALMPEALPKRLDFTSSSSGRAREGTPMELQDPTTLVSDDLPSSPTPSSNKDATPGPLDFDEDVAMEELQDPPSSPPPQEDEEEEDGSPEVEDASAMIQIEPAAVNVTDFALQITNEEPDGDDGLETGHKPEAVVEVQPDDAIEHEAEPAPPSAGETAQLEPESQAVDQTFTTMHDALAGLEEADQDEEKIAQGEDLGETDQLRSGQDDEAEATMATHDADLPETQPAEAVLDILEGTVEADQAGDVSRVEDSFIALDDSVDAASASYADSQQGDSQTRKRKRVSGEASVSRKKKKRESPLKRFIISLFRPGSSQQTEDDDEDMGDNIFVASSQNNAPSPTAPNDSRFADLEDSQPYSLQSAPAVMQETALAASVDNALSGTNLPTDNHDETMPPPKRGRGRPRKSTSAAMTPAQSSEPIRERRARRTSSLASIEGGEDGSIASSPRATRASAARVRHLRGSRTILPEDIKPLEFTRTRRGRKTATAVIIPVSQPDMPEQLVDRQAEADAEDTQTWTPAEQLDAEHAAAVDAEPGVSSSNVKERLHGVLADLKGMMLGSGDTRDICDLLFQVQTETHAAAARARNG